MSGLLDGLPSRGTCTAARPALQGGAAAYVAAHDTAPPPEQVLRTDGTHPLVRALALKREREERAKKAADAAARAGGKRAAEGGAGGGGEGSEGAAKRAAPAPPGPLTAAGARELSATQLKAAL